MVFCLEFLASLKPWVWVVWNVLGAVYITNWGFFISSGRMERPHSAVQLETAEGILFWSSVDSEGAHGKDFSERGLAATATKMPPRDSGPVGQVRFLQLPQNVPFGRYWEDLLCSHSLLNKTSFCSQTLPSVFPVYTNISSIWSDSAEGNRKVFLALPFLPCLTFTPHRFVFLKKNTFGTSLKCKEIWGLNQQW